MNTLEKQFRKSGWDFEQLKRCGNVALFQRTKNGDFLNYEVVVIGSHDGYKIGNVGVPASEFYPSTESWGSKGFTYNDLPAAEAKFAELCAK